MESLKVIEEKKSILKRSQSKTELSLMLFKVEKLLMIPFQNYTFFYHLNGHLASTLYYVIWITSKSKQQQKSLCTTTRYIDDEKRR